MNRLEGNDSIEERVNGAASPDIQSKKEEIGTAKVITEQRSNHSAESQEKVQPVKLFSMR